MKKLQILSFFIFAYILAIRASLLIDIELENKVIERIFSNTTLELLNYDFNNSMPKNVNIDEFIEQFSKQMNLEINKLLNEIFIANSQNSVRNYTNELKEIYFDSIFYDNDLGFSLYSMLNKEDLKEINKNLYNFIFRLKQKKMNKTQTLNENEKYAVGNELIKGLLKYFLMRNRANANKNISIHKINDFDIGEAIKSKSELIEQKINEYINFLEIHRFIHNSTDLNKEQNQQILFNITFQEIDLAIRNSEILNYYQENKNTQNPEDKEKNDFQRIFDPFLITYIVLLNLLIIFSGFLLFYKIFYVHIKPENYDNF